MTGGRKYTNGEITVYWNPRECIHSTLCFRSLRKVFDPMRRPWIDPTKASSEKIKEVIERCPTGALMFSWNEPSRNEAEQSPKLFREEGEKAEPEVCAPQEEAPAAIRFMKDGPMVITGAFSIEADGFGDFAESARDNDNMVLCRCGKSRKQPCCDGTHAETGFKG